MHAVLVQSKKFHPVRSRKLLTRFFQARHQNILPTDEKVVTVHQVVHKQNTRILTRNVAEGSQKVRYVQKTGNDVSFMAWEGVTSSGKTPLLFVPSGEKIDVANC